MLKILSYLLILFIVPIFAEDEPIAPNVARLNAVKDNLNMTSFSTASLVSIAIAILSIIALIVAYEITKTERIRKVQLDAQWKIFERATKERGITPNLMSLLRKIMENSNKHTPEMALQSPRVYELALEAYIQKNKALQSNLNHLEYHELTKLRKALGYDIIHPEMPYVSTRQFRIGDEVNIKFKLKSTGEDSAHPHPAIVSNIDEAKWEISFVGTMPTQMTEIKMSYTRPGDADYLFQVPIYNTQAHALTLGHTIQLMRKQQRNWVRWSTELPILIKGKIRNGEEEIDTELTGTTSDISGGGLSVICDAKFEGKFIQLNFTLPPAKSFRDISAEIIRKTIINPNNMTFRYSLYFANMKEEEREHIVRYIFDQQRQIAKERPI